PCAFRIQMNSGLTLLLGAGAGEDSDQARVSFVAGVLEQTIARPLERNHERPRPRPRRWIGECHLVLDRLRADAREALGDAQVLGGVHQVALRRVVRGLDHERAAFPMAAGVAVPLSDARGYVRASIERDDASVVDVLLHDRDVVAILQDLDIAVVAGGQPRRSEGDAALREAAILPGVGAAAPGALPSRLGLRR